MTPTQFFYYGLAAAGAVIAIGLALVIIWAVFCFFFGPEKTA